MPSFHRPGLTKEYWVYITTSLSRRPLYTGVTDDLERRLYEHKHGNGDPEAFAFKYRAFRLMYSETYSLIEDAIAREKQLKGWSRKKKIALWEADNPEWRDLSEDW
jgi:putative endonuclease